MSALTFFDTNILLYSEDDRYPEKQSRATDLVAKHIQQGSLALSTQVLQEYYSGATRKLGVNPDAARRKVELLARRIVVRLSAADVIAAIELHRLHQLQFWDALIVHAAKLAGATLLYSEDFQHGAEIAGVKVVNPFRRS